MTRIGRFAPHGDNSHFPVGSLGCAQSWDGTETGRGRIRGGGEIPKTRSDLRWR